MTAYLATFAAGVGFSAAVAVVVVVANRAGEAFARRDEIRARSREACLTLTTWVSEVEDVAAIDDRLPKLTLDAVEGKTR